MVTRIITGLILLVVVLAGIFYLPEKEFVWVAVIIVGLAAWEFATLVWKQSLGQICLFLAIFLAIAIIEKMLPVSIVLFCGVAWWALAHAFLWHYVRTKRLLFGNWGYKLGMGLLMFVAFLVSLITLKRYFEVAYLLCGLSIVWAMDIGAYFAGKFFGQHLLAPMISPNKTMEGLGGGLVAAIAVAAGWGFWFGVSGIHWLFWLTLSVVTALWSVIGYLFESVVKRCADVKDSGNILPGHGGIYDRVDSLIAALPIFAFGLLFIRI